MCQTFNLKPVSLKEFLREEEGSVHCLKYSQNFHDLNNQFFCIHKYEMLLPLFPILNTRTCPTMGKGFALRTDLYALAI